MNFQVLNSLMKMTKWFAHRQIRESGLNDTECMICSYVYGIPMRRQLKSVTKRLDHNNTM